MLGIFEQLLFATSGVKRWYAIKSLSTEATPLATQFFKRAYKISHPPQLQGCRIALPSFAASSKIGPDFSKKVGLKLELKCAPKFLFFDEKNIRFG